jgi:uncharacterized membrane protein YdjX (TVP38/TMEM64 family)
MPEKKSKAGRYVLLALLAAGCITGVFLALDPLLKFYTILTDRESIQQFIESWDAAVPFVFILLQVLQVVLAPVPGEISGLIGGYLFGTLPGFIYSSIGLTLGSAINFWIGRLLGKKWIRRWIPAAQREKMDLFVARQGVVVLLIFFIFPGFPKDYLCFFLGVTRLPFNLFILLAGLGRIPGTLLLSLQGDALFDRKYGIYVATLAASMVIVGLAVYFREAIYRWAERANNGS